MPISSPFLSARRLFTFVLWTRRFVALDWNLQQLGILLVIASEGEKGATMGQLSRELHMSQSSTSKNVRMLSEWSSPDGSTRGGRGLIRLEQNMSERPRLIRLHLTEKGAEVLEALERSLAHDAGGPGETPMEVEG